MGKVLIVTEKPSVAQTISKVIGASERKEGYLQNSQYYVTFLYGHLFTLWDAAEYDSKYEKWDMTNLPIFPKEFKYKYIARDGIKKQFTVVKNLLNAADVDYVINGCDGDREGSLIFAEVYEAAGSKKPVKRLWVSSHTPEDLKKGLSQLRTGDTALTQAGYARQWADWLFGINFTVAMTKTFSEKEVLNVGRVILPTVNLVYKRDMEIKNFVSEPYYELLATFKTNQGMYDGYLIIDQETKFKEKDKLGEIFKKVQGQPGVVVRAGINRGTKGPGLLFNLSDLQGEITSRYKEFTADRVLKIAQNLYEKQLITYPRTASRYADNSQVDSACKTLEAVKDFFPKVKFTFRELKSVFDSTKVESHPAIMPTYLVPKDPLSTAEQIVYMEIVKRFVAQFAPPAEFERIEAITEVMGFQFQTKGKVWTSLGWMELYGKEESEEPELRVRLKENMMVETVDLNVLNKTTKPPAHYTVKTLLAAMQNCGKKVEDETVILKGYTIGTPATRAEILNKIEKVGYVCLRGGSFIIQDMGIQLIELFPFREMLEPDFTGKLEKELHDMELGKYSQDVFLKEVQDAVTKGINQFKETKGTIKKKDPEKICLGKCPVCGKNVLEYPKGFGCCGFKEGCKFFIWKNNALLNRYGIKSVSRSLVKVLLENKQTECKLGDKMVPVSLEHNGDRWGLKFAFDNGKIVSLGKCPECGFDVIETPKGFSCSGYKSNGCKFVLWKDDFFLGRYDKRVTGSMVKQFLAKRICKIKGLIDPNTKVSFDGEVQLYKNDKGFWSYSISKKLAE